MKTLAAFSGEAFLQQILVLVVAGVVLWLIIWLVEKSPMPAPFKQVLTWLCYVAGALLLINFLLGLIGHAFITF